MATPATALRATRDAGLVNRFINDPAVFPFCGFPPECRWADVSSRIEDDDLVFVTDGETAAMGFHRRAPRAWEKHNLFLPTCRGRAAIDMGIAMLGWTRDVLGAAIILAFTPMQNRAARWFNRQIGMCPLGTAVVDGIGETEQFRKELACR